MAFEILRSAGIETGSRNTLFTPTRTWSPDTAANAASVPYRFRSSALISSGCHPAFFVFMGLWRTSSSGLGTFSDAPREVKLLFGSTQIERAFRVSESALSV